MHALTRVVHIWAHKRVGKGVTQSVLSVEANIKNYNYLPSSEGPLECSQNSFAHQRSYTRLLARYHIRASILETMHSHIFWREKRDPSSEGKGRQRLRYNFVWSWSRYYLVFSREKKKRKRKTTKRSNELFLKKLCKSADSDKISISIYIPSVSLQLFKMLSAA